MPSIPPRNRFRPGVEALDPRLALSASPLATHPARPVAGQAPAANAQRPFTPADLQAYAAAYTTFRGDPGYTPQYDFNGTGFIGQNNATPILRGLASVTRRVPLRLDLALAPGQQVLGSVPSNSGPTTRLGRVTVVGKTTPNSVIFTDGPTTNSDLPVNNFKFQGIAVTSDAQGRFEFPVELAELSRGGSLTLTSVLVRTPFGQQTIRAFPIRRLP